MNQYITTEKIKKHGAFFVLVGFLFTSATPQFASAAHDNYVSLGNGEDLKYYYTALGPEPYIDNIEDVLDRDEKFVSSNTDLDVASDTTGLPIEGEPSIDDEVWLTVTAYSSTKDQTDDSPFTTAWQTPVRDGVVALNFLPKGSVVKFPELFGDKEFVVEDRMNVRYKFRADIWMHERAVAKKFGLKYTRMQILSIQYPRDYVLEHFEAAYPVLK